MKKFYCLCALALLFMSSCVNVEESAHEILFNFKKSLGEIQDPRELTSYQMGTAIDNSLNTFNNSISELRDDIGDDYEKLSLLDTLVNLEKIKEYHILVEKLGEKNMVILKSISGKKWINASTNSLESIIQFKKMKLSFINFKNQFDVILVNGNIALKGEYEDDIVYLDYNDENKTLTIQDKNNSVEFRIAKVSELIIGDWTWDGKNPDVTFKENGKGIIHNFYHKEEVGKHNFTYTTSGNVLKSKNTNYNAVGYNTSWDHDHYNGRRYVATTDRWVTNYVKDWSRMKKNGPESAMFIFDNTSKALASEPTKSTKAPVAAENSATIKNDSSDNAKWDKVLDDYEEMVDQYIKLYKKAQAGDMSAMTEYAACLEKAQDIQNQLEGAKGDLSTSQAKRMLDIINKLSTGIL